MSMSREEFDCGCKEFIKSEESLGKHRWVWLEHSTYPGLGYMERRTTIHTQDSTPQTEIEETLLETESDDTIAPLPIRQGEVLEVWQSVVYSPSFRVPVFYFSAHYANGAPARCDAIVNSTLMRKEAFPSSMVLSDFAVHAQEQSFPLLTQGEHPTTGTPCWYFHPCETPSALKELIQEDGSSSMLSRRLELWFLLVGNIIDLCV